MILSAGLGTRLLPLTDCRPKALAPVRGVTMLEFWIERLARSGFDTVYLNAFHLRERIDAAISARKWPVPVKVLHESELLGTGGGIRSAAEYAAGEPFVVVNVDILSNADLGAFHRRHKLSRAPVSLLLHDWPEFNNVAVSREGFVLGFGRDAEEIGKKDESTRLMAFTGIHCIDPSAMGEAALGAPCDIIDLYRGLIAKGDPPAALFQRDIFWREMGSVESYARLNRELALLDPGLLSPIETGKAFSIHPEARLAPDCRLDGSVVIGRGTAVGEGVSLENIILWDDVRVEKGSCLQECIVTDGITVSGSHRGKIFTPERK